MNLSLIGEQIATLDNFLINQKAELQERRDLVTRSKDALLADIAKDRAEISKALDQRRQALVDYINEQFADTNRWLDLELKRNEEAVTNAFNDVVASIDHQIVTVQATRGEDSTHRLAA